MNSKINLFGRYNYSPSDLTQRGPLLSTPRVLSMRESVSSSIHTFTLGLNEIMTRGISNEVRANYSKDRVGTKYFLDNFGGAMPLPDSLLFPSGYSSANGQFEFYIVGAGEYAQGNQATDEQRQINLIDNLSVTKGSHQLKFGVDYRWLSPFSSIITYAQFAAFTGMSTSPGDALSGTAAAAFVHALQGTYAGYTQFIALWPEHMENHASVDGDLRFEVGR